MVSSGSSGVPGWSSGVAGGRPGWRGAGRGGGGPAGSGLGSRGRPVRGSGSTDAPLGPPRQVRPPPGRRRQAAARGGRPCPLGKEVRPRGRARRRGWGWRAARPCRRGRPAGAGAGWSRAVTSCAPSPLPGVEAAGPGAGRRGGLACRPGPQASTLDSARRVKSARPPGARPGLTPCPEPRVDAGRYPPGQEGPTPHGGRPPRGCREGGTGARTATVRAPVVPAPAGRPGTGSPGCARRVTLAGGSVIGRSLAPLGFPSHYRNRVFGAFFRRRS
jgi:hypothetical protein